MDFWKKKEISKVSYKLIDIKKKSIWMNMKEKKIKMRKSEYIYMEKKKLKIIL